MTEEKLEKLFIMYDRICNLKKAREIISLFKCDSGIKIHGENYKNEEIYLRSDKKKLLLQWLDKTFEEEIRRTEEKISCL